MAQTVPDRPPLSSCKGVVAPELAYVTARSAALVLFGKIATLLSDLLPVSGAQNAGTVRNRTLRVGQDIVQHPIDVAGPLAAQPAGPVVVGLDGGYVRSRHRQEEHHFEVLAGKVIDGQRAQVSHITSQLGNFGLVFCRACRT
jgi:hypothetical protein